MGGVAKKLGIAVVIEATIVRSGIEIMGKSFVNENSVVIGNSIQIIRNHRGGNRTKEENGNEGSLCHKLL